MSKQFNSNNVHGRSYYLQSKRYLLIPVFIALVLLATTIISTLTVVGSARGMIYRDIDSVSGEKIAILFGAGVSSDGVAQAPLQDRIQVAADLYHRGKVEQILVSGDNSPENHYETDVMSAMLIEQYEVPESVLIVDPYGRRTYDTCARAAEIYHIESALLVTQGFHLYRSIYTCRAVGVDSRGLSASLHEYQGEHYYKFREFMAINRALVDIYIVHPDFVGKDEK